MKAIPLDRVITFGNLLSVATVLVTVAITWATLKAEASQTRTDVMTLQSDIVIIKNDRFSDNSRMVRVETLLETILNEVRAKP